jgi:hypothetical protein
MKPLDLIEHAERLATAAARRPYQADLRRATSAAYYALFHALAQTAADTLIGTTAQHRASETWRRVYRSLEHGFAKGQCQARRNSPIAADLEPVTDAFVLLQEQRHAADYDPLVSFLREDVLASIGLARNAMAVLASASVTDRRTLAAWLIVKSRI